MKQLHRILHIDLQYQIIAVIRILLFLSFGANDKFSIQFVVFYWYFPDQKAMALYKQDAGKVTRE
jgi:hypothetical protein